jgi:hypothetical protein
MFCPNESEEMEMFLNLEKISFQKKKKKITIRLNDTRAWN